VSNHAHSKQDPPRFILNVRATVLNERQPVCILSNCSLNFADHTLNRALNHVSAEFNIEFSGSCIESI